MVDRKAIFAYANEVYQSTPEYLWAGDPDSAVLKHTDNKKWSALIMNVSKEKLGLNDKEEVDIINMKCDPDMIGTLRMINGIFAGYHMNKKYWISVLLDGSVDESMIYDLLDKSFALTENKKRK